MHTIDQRINDFGEKLIQSEIISAEAWAALLEEYKISNLNLDKLIKAKKIFGRSETMQILELYYGVPYVKLSEYILTRDALNLLNEDFCRINKIIPLDLREDKLTIAMTDPTDIMCQDTIKKMSGKDIQVVFAEEDDILRAIDMYYAGAGAYEIKSGTDRFSNETVELSEKAQKMIKLGEETPVVGLVNDILLKAISSNASDIHIEPARTELLIRFRVDGILRVFLSAPIILHPAVISRIKIISGMNITERRMPQDGRTEIKVRDRLIDLRVSCVPSIFGEKIVIRILDKKMAVLDLENIGFTDDNLEKIKRLIKNTYGMILICGPTGSGKTSTGYAICNQLKTIEKNMVSIEDPVEYQIDNVIQIQVNHEIELTFAKILRSVLRQDPDIIMVGEIRDYETLDIAIHSALTGHLVISTLHTQDTPTSIARMLDMGLHAYLINSAVRGIISQRLIRKICPNCKKEIPTPQDLWKAAFGSEFLVPEVVFRGAGCNICFGTGYFGRTAITEVLEITDKIRGAISTNPESSNVLRIAKEDGLVTLKDESLIKVTKGITTIDEILRVNV